MFPFYPQMHKWEIPVDQPQGRANAQMDQLFGKENNKGDTLNSVKYMHRYDI